MERVRRPRRRQRGGVVGDNISVGGDPAAEGSVAGAGGAQPAGGGVHRQVQRRDAASAAAIAAAVHGHDQSREPLIKTRKLKPK